MIDNEIALNGNYDVIVVGAGHAGCESALAAARMGCKTLLITMNLDNIALMPCNPSIGGPAKGHMVREIDALGGEMARNTDETLIQIRMLNTGKGPAVQTARAQVDKKLYGLSMKHALERQNSLHLKQAMVEEVGFEKESEGHRTNERLWVRTNLGCVYHGVCVVLTTGTSLAGRVIIGDWDYPAGRSGEFAAYGLSKSLQKLGFTLGRLKTGTPPRVDARTIDFTRTIIHPGSDVPLYFGHYYNRVPESYISFPNPVYPLGNSTEWRRQLPCYLVNTNEATHHVIRSNLHRAPLFTGVIKSTGPRYCPSIEDKIYKFPNKASHPLFLEPEGWKTTEVYIQGANTSLPEDVQVQMLRTIPALERVDIMRTGYAIEYDFVPPNQINVSLETKLIPGLFLAGQINGTTGYEEAAGQGIIAGINAAMKVKGKPPLILRRDEAYLGVMIDDLVTRELTEPYRIFTSRAEYRLLLRQDNADLRLTPLAYKLGLAGKSRYEAVEARRESITREVTRLKNSYIKMDLLDADILENASNDITSHIRLAEFLCRPDVHYNTLSRIGLGNYPPNSDVARQVETEVKYCGYIERQYAQVAKVRRLEERFVPGDVDYNSIKGLRFEARCRLSKFRPATLGQASRIEGVTPADIAILMVYIEKRRRKTHFMASVNQAP